MQDPPEPRAPLSKSALRRQREREQRLETILAAAGRLFAREGYHRTGMERIADEAEVSVGTVYFYFKNKEDLLVKLLDQTGRATSSGPPSGMPTAPWRASSRPEGCSSKTSAPATPTRSR